jgi:hypothetical protein
MLAELAPDQSAKAKACQPADNKPSCRSPCTASLVGLRAPAESSGNRRAGQPDEDCANNAAFLPVRRDQGAG